MLKSSIWLLAGALIGALLVFHVVDREANPAADASVSPGLLESVADLALGRNRTQRSAEPNIAEKLTVFEQARDETDIAKLQRRLQQAAAEPWSPSRDVEIDALLARLSELAPAQAVTVARTLELDPRFIAAAFQSWAEVEPGAALAALPAVASAAARRDMALALLDVFGDDKDGADRVAAALPASDRDSFRIAWLEALTARDPLGAFRAAEALGSPTEQRKALQRVAAIWAGQDPQSAIAQSEFLPADLARSFRSSAISEWARLDPEGCIAYLEAGASAEDVSAALQYLVASDPDRLMQLADNLSGSLGISLKSSIMAVLAESDPDAAIKRLASMPPGQERDTMLLGVGSALASRDPEAALKWLETLGPDASNAQQIVLMSIIQQDPKRLPELLDRFSGRLDDNLLFSIAMTTAARNPEDAPQIADQLLEMGSIQSKSALGNLVSNWMQRDPDKAFDWVLAHEGSVDANVFTRMGQTMASRDPAAAADYVEKIPQRYRAGWIAAVASQYGRYDPQAALNWLSQYQGQEGYEPAFRQLVVSTSQSDPRAAVQMLGQLAPDQQLGVTSQVVSSWARSEPLAAARWAEAIADNGVRAQATTAVVSAWAASDASAATSWTLRQPSGETRDQALTTLVMRGAQTGMPDPELFRSFSSEVTRQNALATAVMVMARDNPDGARELIAREARDPNVRTRLDDQLRQTLEQQGQSARGVFSTTPAKIR